jgi:hypothetical protein
LNKRQRKAVFFAKRGYGNSSWSILALIDRYYTNNVQSYHYTFFTYFEESTDEYERRHRTHTGNCDGYINFADAKVFKLFCSDIFDRRGHLGADAPHYYHVRGKTKTQGQAVLEWFSV